MAFFLPHFREDERLLFEILFRLFFYRLDPFQTAVRLLFAPTLLATPTVKPPDLSKMITASQVGFLLKLLGKHKISVQSFCQENGINRIEDLSLDDARTIIADLNQK